MEERVFLAKKDQLDEVLTYSNEVFSNYGINPKNFNVLDIVIEELFVNIASYSYPPDQGNMTLRIDFVDGILTLVFIDSGIPFNPLAKEEPDINQEASERPIGGLGIFMVKNMMDEVNYEYIEGQNILTLKKKVG